MTARSLQRTSLGGLLGAVVLAFAGCNPAAQVVGTWNLDREKAISSEFINANPEIGSFLVIPNSQFQVTFAGDGNFTLKAGVGPIKHETKGSWRYVKADGKTLLLMVKEAGQTDENELPFTLVDKDHAEMQITLPFGKFPFSFVRQKPAS